MTIEQHKHAIQRGFVARVSFPEFSNFPIDFAIQHGVKLGSTTNKELAEKYGGRYMSMEELKEIGIRSSVVE